LICAASAHKRLAHFNHATLYTTRLLVHPFLTVNCTIKLYQPTPLPQTPHGHLPVFCISLWLSSVLIISLIHIHFHSFTLHSILSSIKLFNQFFFTSCYHNQNYLHIETPMARHLKLSGYSLHHYHKQQCA